MALDGIVLADTAAELNETLTGGRITKIAQPEKDELLLTVSTRTGQRRLLLSANASLPLVYLSSENKPSPVTAPNFCMLLRKHLSSARILSVTQPGFERVLHFNIEHLNELGDICQKILIIELMGKYSNIIFVDENGRIIDAIKHVSAMMSSVREVLPGRDYFLPKSEGRIPPAELSLSYFNETILTRPVELTKAIYTTLAGFSPLMANEACYRAGVEGSRAPSALTEEEAAALYGALSRMADDIREGRFDPQIIYRDGAPEEFASLALTSFTDCEVRHFDSPSAMLETFYAAREDLARIRQKSQDLRKITANALERTTKKLLLQEKQLADTEKRDKFRLWGELLTTYGYSAAAGAKSVVVNNYYTGEDVKIPLDPTIPALENAKNYFDKYARLKRTFEAASKQAEESRAELAHLQTIAMSLDLAPAENDLAEIREELIESGYLKRHMDPKARGTKAGRTKKVKITSRPYHYRTPEGFDIYVGKNNFQNDELTFHFAQGGDWWFHAKGVPGSHVVVKNPGGGQMPDHVYEEAGALALYYSSSRGAEKASVDYTEKKNVKKPSGGKPGFVVYYTNYSLIASPDLTGLTLLEE